MVAIFRNETKVDFSYLWMLLLWALNFILLLEVLYLYVSAVLLAPVNNDAGTYLSIVEQIRSGAVLYKDFRSAYPPLPPYILSFVRGVTPFSWTNYVVYLATVFAFIFGQGILIYMILRHHRIDRSLSVFAALLALILLAYYDGLGIFLEPFVAFFCLLSLYLILSRKAVKSDWIYLVTAGVVACLALFSKQYALLALPVLSFYLLIDASKVRDGVQNVVIFGLGYSVPIVIFLIYFCGIRAIPFDALFMKLVPLGYITEGHMAMGDFSYRRHLRFLLNAIPFVLVIPFAAYWSRSSDRTVILLFTFMAMFLCAALLIRPFNHYYGLIISIAIIAQLFALTALQKKSKGMALLVVAFVGWGFFRSYIILSSIEFDPSVRSYQFEIAEDINQTWPRGSQVLRYAEPEIMYLADFRSISPNKLGFDFLANFTGAEQIEFISQSDRILIDLENRDYFHAEREKIELEGTPLLKIMEQQFNLVVTIDQRYQLWERFE